MNNQANNAPRLNIVEFWSKSIQSRIASTQKMSRPEELAQARQMIDEELEAMHLTLCSLRTHRNTLTPISSLPLEILARILQLHANDQPPSKRDLGWIRVTHVCRAWRDAALQHPALWSNVTTELGSCWLDLMLERAKYGPLSYRQVNCGKNSKDFLSHVLPQLFPRIHSLSIDDTADIVHALIGSLTTPAPKLQTLELSVMSPRHLDIPLPKRLFNDNAPMLHRLYLKGVHVSLSSPTLFGLTHLHIEEYGDPDHESTRHSGVPQALRQLPALESLYLANTLPIGMSYLDNSPIRLPRLQNLTLIDEGPACTDALGRLEIPASCKIHVECEFYDESELEECLPMLCGCIPVNADPFHTLSVVGVDVDEAKAGLKLWRESNIHGLHLPVDPDLFISAFCPAESHQPANILKLICNTLPLSDIRTIHAQHREGILPRDLWKRLFAKNCRKTNNVSMNKWFEVVSLCNALTMKLDEKLPARGEEEHRAGLPLDHLFLPDLKRISLQSVNLQFCTDWDDKRSVLVNALNMRRSAGRAVSVVRLGKGCFFNAAQLRVLRDIVHVELDPDAILMPEAPVAGSG